jgi:hypothetical protein
MAAANSTFAIGGASCSSNSLVVFESFVFSINTSGKNPPIANVQTVIANGRTTVQQRQTDQNLNIKTETNHFDR